MKDFLTYLFCLVNVASIAQETEHINGLSYVSGKELIDYSNVQPMVDLGANWVSVIPFAFMPESHKPEISFNNSWQWICERKEGVSVMIDEMHAKNLKIMIKPQIWVGMGEYTGHVEMNHFRAWKKLEEGYADYILSFAELAEEKKVEMLCIGTELSLFAKQRPKFWYGLISDVRKVYSGKLTYAENWDSFDDVKFWDSLDYIGVDAYFPLQTKLLTIDELNEAWGPYINSLDSLSNLFDREILFTEYGYRSIPDCAEEPWNYDEEKTVDEEAQLIALSSLYLSFWEKENFAGGFLWKWWPNHESAGGPNDDTFTVQNKKAEELVREVYTSD